MKELFEKWNRHIQEEKASNTIALIAGKFKPPHRGHLEMIQHYSSLADRVIVLVSPLPKEIGDGKEVNVGQSINIWNIYLQDAGLQNVQVLESPTNSPVRAVFDFVGNDDNNPDFAQNGDKIILGVSTKGGDESRFAGNVQKYAKENVKILNPAKYAFNPSPPAVNATDFRAALAKNEDIRPFLPETSQNDRSIERITSLFSNNVQENTKNTFNSWREFLNEGGNVFAGRTESIPREFIHPTLERYYQELKRLFPLKNRVFGSFKPVGSVGKKDLSGDIDLAIDSSDIFPNGEVNPKELMDWNIDPEKWKETFDKFKKRSRTRTDKEIGWRAFFSELAEYIDNNSELIVADLKKISPSTMFSLFPQITDEGEQKDVGVQIDWMIGNRQWLEFAYYSDPPSQEDKYLKGLHRTQLMLSMFLVKGMSYDHSSGLKDKETRKLITDDPYEVTRLLGKVYGGRIDRKETNNFHSLHNWLKSNSSASEYDEAIGAFIKILDRTKSVKLKDKSTGEVIHCGYIPKELEDLWIQKQEELDLRGKYICRDTNEKIWNHINEKY